MKQIHIFLVLLSIFFSLSATAAWKIDRSTLELPEPPESGSAGERKDFEILLKYQETRTDDDCRAADRQTRHGLASFFGPQIGVLSAREMALVEEFSSEVIETVDRVSATFKKRFSRDRPYDSNPAIKPCIRAPGGHKSYPSSHAAVGVVLSDFLAKIFPKKKELLHRAGMRAGENRVLGGVHHPSDVKAGRMLGVQIEKALLSDHDFIQSLEALMHY